MAYTSIVNLRWFTFKKIVPMIQYSGADIEIKVNDILVSYNEAGDKKHPVIIFVHGFPFDKSMWNDQLDALSNRFRCIAYDLSGYGRTTAREEFSIETFADDLDAFMHIMQIESAAVCGLSMGGYIALRAISKYPERFSSLLLCDTQCIADTPEAKQKRANSIRQIEAEGLTTFAEGFVKNIFTAESLQSKKAVTEKIKSVILNTAPSSITGTLKALAEREETCSILSDIKIPVLIICGKEDKVTPPPQAEFLHKNIRGSQLRIIESAAHLSNLEQPQQFNEAIDSFL
jgi:3-oxoadipate enol-lactonase